MNAQQQSMVNYLKERYPAEHTITIRDGFNGPVIFQGTADEYAVFCNGQRNHKFNQERKANQCTA